MLNHFYFVHSSSLLRPYSFTMILGIATDEFSASAKKVVGKQTSYSLSLWERARVRARSVEKERKKEKKVRDSFAMLANPSPPTLSQRERALGRRRLCLDYRRFLGALIVRAIPLSISAVLLSKPNVQC